MISTKLITAPTEKPVTVAEVKSYLRIDIDDDDTLFEALIDACTDRIERHIDRKLCTQTWSAFYDHFPNLPMSGPNAWWDGVREGAISQIMVPSGTIKLPFGPINSAILKTYADDGIAVVADASTYVTDIVGQWGRVSLKLGQVWPTTILRHVNGIEIECEIGSLAANVPEAIKRSIVMFVAQIYENRGDEPDKMEMPSTCLFLLAPYKRMRI